MKKFLRRIRDRVGRRKFRIIFSTIICLPIVIWCFYRGGWSSLVAALAGVVVGQLISSKIFKD